MPKELDTFIKSKILEYFGKNCPGRAKAKVKDDLIVELDNCYGIKLSERDFRAYMSDLPQIGSHNSTGYYLIRDLEDLRLAQAEIHSMIVALSDRARKQETAFYERQGNQGSLL
jgi:hypothetical protein